MRKSQNTDKQVVIDILYNSFVGIKIPNSINFVVKQDQKRDKRIRYLMEYMFNIAFSFGEIFISDNENGCILIVHPHKKRTSLNTLCWDFKLVFKTIGLENVFRVLKRERQLKKQHLNEPHIHPMIIGVKKEFQGRGVGPRLIQEVMSYHKNNKLSCIIETTTRSNLKLYEKFGFRVTKETSDLNYPLFYLRKDF